MGFDEKSMVEVVREGKRTLLIGRKGIRFGGSEDIEAISV